MSNYPMVSAKVVMASLIRGLGYKLPSQYTDDLLEWIPEALEQLQVTSTLVRMITPDKDCGGELIVKNYRVELPCGFQAVIMITDEHGNKLLPGIDARPNTDTQRLQEARAVVFNTNPNYYTTSDGTPTTKPGTSVPLYGQDLTPTAVTNSLHFYQIQGNCIQTSMCDGFIQLTYYAIPTCDDGYPLIPDNGPFKMAIEFWVLTRLIGSGYDHPTFKYQDALALYEKYAARGVGEISYPSPDKMAKTAKVLTRLMPPTSYQEDFFVNT